MSTWQLHSDCTSSDTAGLGNRRCRGGWIVEATRTDDCWSRYSNFCGRSYNHLGLSRQWMRKSDLNSVSGTLKGGLIRINNDVRGFLKGAMWSDKGQRRLRRRWRTRVNDIKHTTNRIIGCYFPSASVLGRNGIGSRTNLDWNCSCLSAGWIKIPSLRRCWCLLKWGCDYDGISSCALRARSIYINISSSEDTCWRSC